MLETSETTSITTAETHDQPADYRDQVRRAVLADPNFAQLTLKGQRKGEPLAWRQIVVRPVHIKNDRYLQFSYFNDRQDITKNYRGSEAAARLDEALALPFSAIHVQSTADDWHVQITKKGTPIIHRDNKRDSLRDPNRADTPPTPPALAHDHEKKLPLPADHPDAYLQSVGIMDANGKIRPAMHAKFAQVNAFLTLLDHELDQPFAQTPLEILDCGCGSAYLSFAAYHYLNDVRHLPARLTGIDTNGKLIDKDTLGAAQLGYDGACFANAAIIDYAPTVPPDILLALHACDTATDEAIALGIRSGARVILCAPCCHHDLRKQLEAVTPFEPVLRHGILKQRMAELLTDSFRALFLRMMGYKTDVIEFVSPEHTDKNVMIRAVKSDASASTTADAISEYAALKAFWHVTPYLEKLIAL